MLVGAAGGQPSGSGLVLSRTADQGNQEYPKLVTINLHTFVAFLVFLARILGISAAGQVHVSCVCRLFGYLCFFRHRGQNH